MENNPQENIEVPLKNKRMVTRLFHFGKVNWKRAPKGLYVGFFARLFAGLIDFFIAATVFALFVKRGINLTPFVAKLEDVIHLHSVVVKLFPFLFFFFLYHVVAIIFSPNQATLGGKLYGLMAVSDKLEKISTTKGIIRIFVAFIFLGLGFVTIFFTKRKRALHDLIIGTCVVNIMKFNEV